MKIYSFDENTHELLINTLREVDYIDACTPAIPLSSVIADQPLPVLGKQQTLIVSTTRNANGYLTVSENISVIDDYRQMIVYDTGTGEEKTITQLEPLPDDVRLRDRRLNAVSLSRFQFFSEIEIKLNKNKE